MSLMCLCDPAYWAGYSWNAYSFAMNSIIDAGMYHTVLPWSVQTPVALQPPGLVAAAVALPQV